MSSKESHVGRLMELSQNLALLAISTVMHPIKLSYETRVREKQRKARSRRDGAGPKALSLI